ARPGHAVASAAVRGREKGHVGRPDRGDRMSQPPAPDVAEVAPRSGPQALTSPGIDAILADFRGWLTALTEAPTAGPPPVAPPDLHTLLAQLTALRHEVNLQTKATRTQQEQNAETLRQLTAALEGLEQAQTAARENQ